MSERTLVIANKNYSSWSLRAWLALRHAGVDFREVLIPLAQPDTAERIREWSPSGRVPALVDDAVTVWDSLAICEYAAERWPEARLWPDAPAARAAARSVCAEMHSGFQALRANMPMNMRTERPVPTTAPGVVEDVDRIIQLWEDCRARWGGGGPLLFGAFSAADAFFAPVVSRFKTYGVSPGGVAGAYMDTVWSLPALQDWFEAAVREPWGHPTYD